jgi:hypothetical protein
MSDFINIRPVGGELFQPPGGRAGGREGRRMDGWTETDMMQLTVAFRNFLNAPRDVSGYSITGLESKPGAEDFKDDLPTSSVTKSELTVPRHKLFLHAL